MESWIQITTGFSLAGATLVILLLVIRFFLESQKKQQEFFVQTINKKDELLSNQHTEIKELAEKSNDAIIKFTQALAVNTETNKNNADSLTKVVFELMDKKKGV